MPTPTDAQIDKVREVAGELDYDFVSSLIDLLTDAQWTRAQEFMTAWGEYPEGDTIGLEGGRDAVLYSSETSRGDIRVRMRLLLGLPEFRDSGITGAPGTLAIRNTWVY